MDLVDMYFFFVLVFWSAYKNDRKKYFRTAAPAEISDCWSDQSNERYLLGTNLCSFFFFVGKIWVLLV